MVRNVVCLLFFGLAGCAYSPPKLIAISDLKADRLDSKANLAGIIVSVSAESDVISVTPLDERVPWQVIPLSVSEINRELSKHLSSSGEAGDKCEIKIKILSIKHRHEMYGMNYDGVYVHGRFYRESECDGVKEGESIEASYLTDAFFFTPDANSKAYSEAIYGLLLSAVSADDAIRNTGE